MKKITLEETVKIMGEINKSIYGINPYKKIDENVDAIVGVGDEMEKLEMPSDEEIDAMYEQSHV